MGGTSPERRHHYTETTEAYLSKFRKDLNQEQLEEQEQIEAERLNKLSSKKNKKES